MSRLPPRIRILVAASTLSAGVTSIVTAGATTPNATYYVNVGTGGAGGSELEAPGGAGSVTQLRDNYDNVVALANAGSGGGAASCSGGGTGGNGGISFGNQALFASPGISGQAGDSGGAGGSGIPLVPNGFQYGYGGPGGNGNSSGANGGGGSVLITY